MDIAQSKPFLPSPVDITAVWLLLITYNSTGLCSQKACESCCGHVLCCQALVWGTKCSKSCAWHRKPSDQLCLLALRTEKPHGENTVSESCQVGTGERPITRRTWNHGEAEQVGDSVWRACGSLLTASGPDICLCLPPECWY